MNVFPAVVILASEEAIAKFRKATAKMRECEYDLDEVVEEVLCAVGLPPTAVFNSAMRNFGNDGLDARDSEILTKAKLELAEDLGTQCTHLGLYDEQGTLGYRPTGWILTGDIVLTRGDLPA